MIPVLSLFKKKNKFKKLWKSKRRLFVIAIFIVGLGYLATYQNCAGYHERSSTFSISASQADAYMDALSCVAGSDPNYTAANQMWKQEGALNFIADTVDEGTIDIVAPLSYSSLRPDGLGTPQTVYVFFDVTSNNTGSLTIGYSDSGASPGASPNPSSTSATSCSNSINVTAQVTAVNDGTHGLEPGNVQDGQFEMEMTYAGPNGQTQELRVRSYDVDDDGNLQSVIQLEVNQVDPTTGEEIFLGDINFVQPQ